MGGMSVLWRINQISGFRSEFLVYLDLNSGRGNLCIEEGERFHWVFEAIGLEKIAIRRPRFDILTVSLC